MKILSWAIYYLSLWFLLVVAFIGAFPNASRTGQRLIIVATSTISAGIAKKIIE